MRCSIVTVAVLFLIANFNAYGKNTPVSTYINSREEMYEQGMKIARDNKPKKAAEKLQQISNLYPFSETGIKSLKVAAFLYYLNGDYSDAILSANNYMKFYWKEKDIEYIHYLHAMSCFMKIRDSVITPEHSIQAKQSFADMILQFPNSIYRDSAIKHLEKVNEYLASYSINIGKFYMKQGSYAAAIPRFQRLIKEYPHTTMVVEANYRLLEAFLILDIKFEAEKYFEILQNINPKGKWLHYAQNIIAHRKKSSTNT